MAPKRKTLKFDGATTCPDKKGVFAIRIPGASRSTFYSYWDGKRWGYRSSSVRSAWLYRQSKALGPVVWWWGFVEKQK